MSNETIPQRAFGEIILGRLGSDAFGFGDFCLGDFCSDDLGLDDFSLGLSPSVGLSTVTELSPFV